MSNEQKPEFPASMMLYALKVYGYKMSDQALEPYVRQRILDFLGSPHCATEIYDFCDELSKLPCERFGKNPNGGAAFSVGDIDSFGQKLFEVEPHYTKPEPDDIVITCEEPSDAF